MLILDNGDDDDDATGTGKTTQHTDHQEISQARFQPPHSKQPMDCDECY